MKHTIYLDHASTTPLSFSMKSYLASLLDIYGNPSSVHSAGVQARQLITDARQSVAALIQADPEELYFTPSGSAGNTLAVKGMTSEDPQFNQYEVFYSPTVHASMRNACESCLHHTPLHVNPYGEIELSALDNILERHRGWKPFVCVEAANSEIGTIQDIMQIGTIVHKHQGVLLVDATGYLPYYPVNMNIWRHYVDILTFSGHKLHALKGTGVLWKQQAVELKPLIYGSQEHGLIGGTENVLGIASLGRAARFYDYSSVNSNSRDYISHYILRQIPDSYLVGASKNRLPHNLYQCFCGVDGESLMIMLDLYGIQVSTGSACNSHSLSPSAALSAIGMKEEDIHSCIRFTFSGSETQEELDYVCTTLKHCVTSLRNSGSR